MFPRRLCVELKQPPCAKVCDYSLYTEGANIKGWHNELRSTSLNTFSLTLRPLQKNQEPQICFCFSSLCKVYSAFCALCIHHLLGSHLCTVPTQHHRVGTQQSSWQSWTTVLKTWGFSLSSYLAERPSALRMTDSCSGKPGHVHAWDQCSPSKWEVTPDTLISHL